MIGKALISNRHGVRGLLLIACLAAGALVGGASEAKAHGFDYDNFAAQTTGAYVGGWMHWTTLSGGHGGFTIRDTLSDGHCARGYVRAIFTDGTATPWEYWGQACGYGQTYSDTFGEFRTAKAILKMQIKAYRTGVGNSDIYAISPGGL